MPIAPITGKLRKRLWLDLSCALGFGISSAYAYWFVTFLQSKIVGLFTHLTPGMAFI
jgi:cytochrome c oxidase subunit 7